MQYESAVLLIRLGYSVRGFVQNETAERSGLICCICLAIVCCEYILLFMVHCPSLYFASCLIHTRLGATWLGQLLARMHWLLQSDLQIVAMLVCKLF